MKGFILITIKDYFVKEAELCKIEGVEKYAGGRIDEDGNRIPDIVLKDGNYFIPYKNGTDEITVDDLITE